MFDLVVRRGTVVTAVDKMKADIAVADGKIVAIGESLPSGQQEVDASGLLVLPGGVDSHVHCEQRGNASGPEMEDFLSVSISAAAGGTTSFISFARQERGEGILESVEDYQRRATKSIIDYSFHLTITDPTPQVIEHELPSLIQKGHRSIKIFMTTERSRVEDKDILRLLSLARDYGALVVVHAENYDLTNWCKHNADDHGESLGWRSALAKPPVVEREAVHRIISLAEIVGTPIQIFHVTCEAALAEIERAQRRGIQVFAETCPQYLLLSLHDLTEADDQGLRFVYGPPPRTFEDREALWAALARRAIGVVSSDHVPHNLGGVRGKREAATRGDVHTIPHGIPGIETRLPLLFYEGVVKGRIDIHRFVELTATNPAKLFGLYPRKGSLQIGSDADLVLWNPFETRTIRNADLHHKVDYTPYEGRETTGWPAVTILRGQIVWDRGAACVGTGNGQWLPRDRYDFPLSPFM